LIAHVVWKLTGDKVQITPFTPNTMMFADDGIHAKIEKYTKKIKEELLK